MRASYFAELVPRLPNEAGGSECPIQWGRGPTSVGCDAMRVRVDAEHAAKGQHFALPAPVKLAVHSFSPTGNQTRSGNGCKSSEAAMRVVAIANSHAPHSGATCPGARVNWAIVSGRSGPTISALSSYTANCW